MNQPLETGPLRGPPAMIFPGAPASDTLTNKSEAVLLIRKKSALINKSFVTNWR